MRDGATQLPENTKSIELSSSSESGSYEVRIASSLGCTSSPSDALDLIIEPLPTTPSIATTGSSICADGSQITLTSDVAPDGGTYLWFKDGDPLPGEGSQNIILNAPTETGVYQVQVVDGNGAMCTSLSSAFEAVEIFELPTVPVAGDDRQLCEVTSTTLNGNTPVIGTGIWQTISAGVIINDPSDAQTNVSGLTPGLHEFTWQIDNGACIGIPDVMTIEVFAAPSPAITEGDKLICDLTTTSISADAIAVGAGRWEIISGIGVIANENNPNTTLSSLELNSTVILSWTVTNGNCTEERDELSIQVSSSPSAAETSGDQQLCASTTTSVQATLPTIGTGTWTVIAGTVNIQDPSITNTDVSALIPGESVTLRWTVSNECGSNFADLVIENEAAPDVANAGDDQELCAVTNSTLTGSGNGGQWTIIQGTGTFENSNDPTSSISNLTIGENIFRYTIDAAICDDTFDDVSLTVFESPSEAFAGPDITLCEGESSINLAATPPAIGIGEWSIISGEGAFANSGDANTTVAGLPLGESILQWEVSNGSCDSNVDQLRVFIYASPNISEESIVICQSESVELMAVGGDTYLWEPTEGLSLSNVANPVASPERTTIYTVFIGREGCTDAQFDITVEVNPTPTLTVSNDTTIFTGQNVQLFARGADIYAWTPAESLDDASSASPIATPITSTTYTVIGTNEFNCAEEAQVNVVIDTDFEIFIPDLFSPNGDQVNDVLLVNTLGVDSFELKIFDRKGRQVFVGANKGEGWDGTFNGSDMAMDNYIYFVVAQLSTGDQVTKKGSVQLIR